MALVLADGQCFSHGQVYVAMSRVVSINGIRIFSPHTSTAQSCVIDNVVYYELLSNNTPPITEEARAQPNVESLMEIDDEENGENEDDLHIFD